MAYLCVCAQSCLTLYNLMDYTHQASLSMVLYQHGIQSRLPFPPAGYLPKQGIRPESPALAGGVFTLNHLGSQGHV